jgi:hypothetical protein
MNSTTTYAEGSVMAKVEKAAVEKVEEFEDGTKLLSALKSGDLSHDDVYVGMVKESEKENHIAFAPGSCDDGWIDVPAKLVGKVEVLRHVPCHDHSHPLVRLALNIDETNAVQVMVRQMFTSAGSRAPVGTQSPTGIMPTDKSSWSGAVSALGGLQGPQLGSVPAFFPSDQFGQPFSPSDQFGQPFFPSDQFGQQFASIAMASGPIGGGGGGEGIISCDLDCDRCHIWPGIPRPCRCKLRNCRVGWPRPVLT